MSRICEYIFNFLDRDSGRARYSEYIAKFGRINKYTTIQPSGPRPATAPSEPQHDNVNEAKLQIYTASLKMDSKFLEADDESEALILMYFNISESNGENL